MAVKKSLFKYLGNTIRSHHMNRAIAKGARICDIYLRYYYNQKFWDMERNGELLILRILASQQNGSHHKMTIFDIGANKGEYVKTIRSVIHNSIIHCFEIVPDTRQTLIHNLAETDNLIVSDCGLSDKSGFLEIGFNKENDTEARVSSNLTGAKTVITCQVQTGDEYCQENNIEEIDLLKIDTEGHEIPILEGFTNTLSTIKVIQFEYGNTWIPHKHFLWEAYEILEPAGFLIGRIYPDGVLFKPYNQKEDEHLRMGNYVAVHKTNTSLINALNLNPTEYC
jgi:FkbM family methyltransferase